MNESQPTWSMVNKIALEANAQRRVADARRLFRRSLANWASDLLQLRAAGMLKPAWREFDDETFNQAA